jgi:integrase
MQNSFLQSVLEATTNRVGISQRQVSRKKSIVSRIFGSNISPHMAPQEATQKTIHFIQEQLHNRHWKYSTAATYWYSMMDMLDTSSVQVRDFSRYLETQKISETVSFPTPLTKAHAMAICETLKFERRIPELAFVSTCWALASRVSDLLQVEAHNIRFLNATTISVTFTRGKGVVLRGQAYTVACHNPFLPTVQRFLQSHPQPFSTINIDRLRTMMRTFNETYEMRSFRRGALQEMAQQGVDLAVLQTISGHATRETLLRYLSWGKFATAQHLPQQEATELLW